MRGIRNLSGLAGAGSSLAQAGGGGGVAVKQTILGTAAIPNLSTSVDVTIPAVDMTKAIVVPSSVHQSLGYVAPSQASPALELINSTTVRVYRDDNNGVLTVGFWVMEFEGDIAVQRGSQFLSTDYTATSFTTYDIAVSELDLTKTLFLPCEVTSNRSGNGDPYHWARFDPANSTSTSLKLDVWSSMNGSHTGWTYWQVLEFL